MQEINNTKQNTDSTNPTTTSNKVAINMNDLNKEMALELIKESKTIALVPSKIAGTDSFGAAVGLYFTLLDMQKDVYFVYPGKVPDDAKGLIEKDRIVANVDERELLVTIDYAETPAASAHYATEGEALTIKLGPVAKDFSVMDRVKIELVGFEFDLIVVFGAQEIEDLGGTFTHLRESFSHARVINIDNTERNGGYGDVNLIDPTAISLSQQVFKYTSEWQMAPSEKSAKAFLTGMTYRTLNNPVANA
ncbi:hypothetical protein HYV31_00540 [candidate division WWE3 bacterium]|nr:hypothetical protein [candidate division WWE3 bacterium]